MSVPAPRDMICFDRGRGELVGVEEVVEDGSERKASTSLSRAVVRQYVPGREKVISTLQSEVTGKSCCREIHGPLFIIGNLLVPLP